MIEDFSEVVSQTYQVLDLLLKVLSSKILKQMLKERKKALQCQRLSNIKHYITVTKNYFTLLK